MPASAATVLRGKRRATRMAYSCSWKSFFAIKAANCQALRGKFCHNSHSKKSCQPIDLLKFFEKCAYSYIQITFSIANF
jgi:hypothetical protein